MSGEMYCKRCGYNLRGASGHGCPECGHYFNPNDSKTYLWENGDRMPRGIWFVLALQGFIVLLFLAVMVFVSLNIRLDEGEAILIAIGFVVVSAPVQLMALFYGTCMALFETSAVVAKKRKWFLMIVLFPWFFVVGVFGIWALLDYLF